MFDPALVAEATKRAQTTFTPTREGERAVGTQVVAALRQAREELTAGALLTVDPNRSRLRLLPLPPKNSGGR